MASMVTCTIGTCSQDMAENKNVISKNKLKDRLYHYISDNMGLIAISINNKILKGNKQNVNHI